MPKKNLKTCVSGGWNVTVNNTTNAPIYVPENLDACPDLNPCVYNWMPSESPSPQGDYVVNVGEQAQFTFQCANQDATGTSLVFSGTNTEGTPFTCDFQNCWNSCGGANIPQCNCPCTNNAHILITQAVNINGDNPVATISIVGKSINSLFTLVARPVINTKGLSLSFTDATTVNFSAQPDINVSGNAVYNPFQFEFYSDQIFIQANIPHDNSNPPKAISGSNPVISSEFGGQKISGNLSFTISNSTITAVSGEGLTMDDSAAYTLLKPEYLQFQSPVMYGEDSIPYAYIAMFDKDGEMSLDENNNFTITMPFENSFTEKFTSVSGVFSLGALGIINFSGKVSSSSDKITGSALMYANKIPVPNISVSFKLDSKSQPAGIIITGVLPITVPANSQAIEPLQGYYSILFS